LLQDGLNDLAGTSSAHYTDFRNQVIAFANEWRQYFIPRMFNNEKMQAEDFGSLPTHSYSSAQVPSHYNADLIGLLFFLTLATAGSLWVYRKNRFERMIAL
jgi:ABC-2 type transport system permease protein